jgi:hypothetical protein
MKSSTICAFLICALGAVNSAHANFIENAAAAGKRTLAFINVIPRDNVSDAAKSAIQQANNPRSFKTLLLPAAPVANSLALLGPASLGFVPNVDLAAVMNEDSSLRAESSFAATRSSLVQPNTQSTAADSSRVVETADSQKLAIRSQVSTFSRLPGSFIMMAFFGIGALVLPTRLRGHAAERQLA